MPELPRSTTLLQRVQNRLRLTSWAQTFYVSSLGALGLALIAILAIRLGGLFPEVGREPRWLLAAPVLALISAFLLHRRVEQQAAARAIDEHARTNDLFLTVASLESSSGDYQPLVAQTAEDQADKIVPTEVVPFRFWNPLGNLAGAIAVMALVISFVPQLDPFGHVEAAAKVEEQKKEIEAIKSEAKKRKERLKKIAVRADEKSDEIDQMIEGLKKDFRKMEPKKVEANAKVLAKNGESLGEQWKASARNEALRRMMNEPISEQQLAGTRTKKMNEWLKDLQEGNTDSLQKALQQAQEKMQALAEAKTPEERQKLASELQKDLQDLTRFSKDKAGSKELSDALSKAMKSLQAAKENAGKPGSETDGDNPMNKEAMEALKESLELSEQELEQLAQAAKDLKKLDEAMKTLQKAQQLNQKEQLDGSKCEGCETLADYEEMYAQMQQGAAEGPGNRGTQRGFGKGGEAEEDDSDPEGYKTEKEKPQVQAGKVLLSIKTKEYATEKDFDPNEMRQYQDSIQNLKSSVQSAIETEEVPPGYRESIKGYFDKIEKVNPELSKGGNQ